MAEIGVKIKLEGAPQYTESMKNVTAQTKLYQAQVKSLQSQMGSGVSAFQKSIATQKALQQQLDAMRNKSSLLEDQIAKMTEKYDENDTRVLRLKTQYQALQGQIAETQRTLDDMGGTMGAVSSQFKEVGDKLGAIGDKIGSVGDTLTKKLTVPIMALGGASLAAFNEVDGAMDTLITKTGATGEALEGMEDIVKDIATTIPTSFDTAANAVGEVNTRFGSTGEQLEELSSAFVKFAEINGTDVSSSIDNVQKALSAYGLSAEDAVAVLDRMNKVGQDTGVSVEKLASGIVSNGTAFQELGLNIDEAVTFMGQLEKSGANSETVLNGMRKALKAATAEGKPLDEALSDLQATIENGTGSMDGLTAAYDIFGKSGDQIYGAVKNGTIDFNELVGAMDSAAGSVSDTFEATLDPVDELQTNLNELKILGTDIANKLMPTIKKAMKMLGDTISKVSDAWNGLSEGQQEAIIKMLGIAAVVGPIISAISSVIGIISSISTVIGTVIGWIPAISGALSTVGALLTGTIIPAIGGVIAAIVPFLPIIAGVVAAIAAAILIFKNWGTITEWIQEKWALLTEFLSLGITTITDFLREHLGVFGDILATRIELIVIAIQTAFELIKIIFTTIGQVLKAIWQGDWDSVGEILANAFIKIVTVIQNAKQKIWTKVKELIQGIADRFSKLKDDALTWGKDMIQKFIDGIKEKWEALKETVKAVAQSVKDFLGFSVPKTGPLHSFDDWPKHMMQQYAAGIDAASFLVRNAVADVAADVAVLQNPFDSQEMYDAVRSGASDANLSLAIGEREFTRALRDMGVAF